MLNSEEKLTDEQVENWRMVLSGMLGPYAFLMTKKDIQAYRDAMQEYASRPEKELKEELKSERPKHEDKNTQKAKGFKLNQCIASHTAMN